MPTTASVPAALPSRPAARRALLGMLVIVAAVFARGLGGAFVYDDTALIVQNPGVHDPFDLGLWARPLWGEQLGHWRPLTAQLFAFGWWLGGGAPWPIHLLALLLHLVAATAVWRLWRQCGGGERGALFAMALFALHPVQVEAVTWCAAVNDPLWGCFALWGGVHWWQFGTSGRGRSLSMACVLALAAMLAKEAGVLTPVLYLGIDLARGHRAAGRHRWVWLVAPLLVWWLARVVVFADLTGGLLRTTWQSPEAGFGQGLAIASGLAARLLWPSGGDLFATPALDVTTIALAMAIAAALAVACWRGRAARVGALAIASSLLLTALSQRALGQYALGERYLYVATAGLALLLASDRGGAPLLLRWLLVAVAAVTTSLRVGDFADEPTLVARALTRHPEDPRLHCMQGRLALLRHEQGDGNALPAAEAAFARARAQIDSDLARRDHLGTLRADVATGLAWCALHRQGSGPRPDFAAVERHFATITAQWPERAEAFVGLGIVRAMTQRFGPAEEALQRALALDPAIGAAHFNLARLLRQRGALEQARQHAATAVWLAPHDAMARDLLQQIEADARRR